MPSASDHEAWSARSERFAAFLDDTEWTDWAMTALFYAAVHDVSAFLVSRKAELKSHGIGFPTKHREIKRVLTDHFPTLFVPYDSLLDRSWWGRYRGKTFGKHELILAQAQLKSLREEIAKNPTISGVNLATI